MTSTAPGSQAATHQDLAPAWSAVPQSSIIEILEQGCSADPERPLLIVEDGLSITRRAFLEKCSRFAGYLESRVRPGERVTVMLDNRIEFMIALFAIVANRAVLVSIAPLAQSFDVGHIVADAAPTAMICGKAQWPVIEAVRPASAQHVIIVDGDEPDGLDPFMADAPPMDLARVACERDDAVAIYYTSGTTGRPKGCILRHGWMLRVTDLDLRMFARGWQDRQLCCLPFYYVDPVLQLLIALASRGTVIAMRRFSVSRFWQVVRKFDATEILSIASIPALLLKGEPATEERDHGIRLAIHAGLPKELHRQILDRFGFHWHNQYGSTEGGIMSRVPHHLADELVGTGTMGVEPPGVSIRIVDAHDIDVAEGETGEALIQGPDLYAGYLNHPDATAEANRGGWYHSGDLVRRDARGLLYFEGRTKEIIRRSGENISAAEVEALLRSHPMIVEAAVIPVPDDLRGEEVKAYVQLQPGRTEADLPPNAIVAFCAANLAPFKVPRFIAYQNGDFERTPSMRVQKQALLANKAGLRVDCWDHEIGQFR